MGAHVTLNYPAGFYIETHQHGLLTLPATIEFYGCGMIVSTLHSSHAGPHGSVAISKNVLALGGCSPLETHRSRAMAYIAPTRSWHEPRDTVRGASPAPEAGSPTDPAIQRHCQGHMYMSTKTPLADHVFWLVWWLRVAPAYGVRYLHKLLAV